MILDEDGRETRGSALHPWGEGRSAERSTPAPMCRRRCWRTVEAYSMTVARSMSGRHRSREMSITEVVIFLGLAGVVLATQLGRRQFTLRRLFLPVLIAIGIGYKYLQGI